MNFKRTLDNFVIYKRHPYKTVGLSQVLNIDKTPQLIKINLSKIKTLVKECPEYACSL